jgi:hypothetical protein
VPGLAVLLKVKNKFRQNGPSSGLMAKQSEKTGFSDFWGFIRTPKTAFQQGVNINTSGIFKIPRISFVERIFRISAIQNRLFSNSF